jgi:OPA family glycerol-3-phosphate transporter-like MFS transporter
MTHNDPDPRAASMQFRRLRWRMLLATMFCYLFFYTGRQNFGFAVPQLRDELELSNTQVGIIDGGMLLCYGIGQAISGNLADTFGARRLMTIGALLSVSLNWVVSFGYGYWAVLLPWCANGFAQSLGFAPGCRLIAAWWHHGIRGRAYGLYVFAAGFSSILTFALCLLVLSFLDWQWIFRLPVLLMLLGAGVFYFLARDRPQDAGLEPPPWGTHSCLPDTDAAAVDAMRIETVWQRYRGALTNGRFLLACAAMGCDSIARYGLLNWVPMHYLGPNWRDDPHSRWISLALPIGMALGALSAGYISDRLFATSRTRPIALCLALASAAALLLYAIPAGERLAGVGLLFLVGFFVYAPQSLFWALCPDLLGLQRSGTGVGVMDACAYGAAALGNYLIGATIDATGATASAFAVVSAVSFLGALLILPVRK